MDDCKRKQQIDIAWNNLDFSKLPEQLIEKIDIDKEVKQFSLLVTGRTGAGKSTFVNGILGMRIGEDQHAPESNTLGGPGTLKLTPYCKAKGQITVTVWDSRGLLDGSSEKDQARIMQEMVAKCSNVDLKLVCIDMTQRRFVQGRDNPDILAMIKITEAFGVEFWENVMIILTFANEMCLSLKEDPENKAKEFTRKTHEWKMLIHKALVEDACIPRETVRSIKVVPAGHYNEFQLPDRDYWLADLWFECLSALTNTEAQAALVRLNINRLKLESEVDPDDKLKPIEDQPIAVPTDEEKRKTKLPHFNAVLTVAGYTAGGGASGAAIESAALAAGPLGAIGIPVGVLVGVIAGLSIGFHEVRKKKNS